MVKVRIAERSAREDGWHIRRHSGCQHLRSPLLITISIDGVLCADDVSRADHDAYADGGT